MPQHLAAGFNRNHFNQKQKRKPRLTVDGFDFDSRNQSISILDVLNQKLKAEIGDAEAEIGDVEAEIGDA